MSKLSKQMAEAAAMPRKVAVYAHLTVADQFIVAEVRYNDMDEHWQKLPPGQEREEPHYGHVRISEILTVTCVPIAEDILVANAVSSLDKQIRDLDEEHYEATRKLKSMRHELLALSYEGPKPAPEVHVNGGFVDEQGREVDPEEIVPGDCVDEGCPQYGSNHVHVPMTEAERADVRRATQNALDDDIPF